MRCVSTCVIGLCYIESPGCKKALQFPDDITFLKISFGFVKTQVNSVNCNTSWKVVLFMKWSDNKETILKGVRRLLLTLH